MRTILVFLPLLLFLSQCQSLEYMEHREQIENNFASGNYNGVSEIIEGSRYRSEDNLLRKLELATSLRYAGEFEQSTKYFHRAEEIIDSLYGVSVTRNLRALIINDYQLIYEGEDYENIYINMFKALNFLNQNDLDRALIESRRISFKLQNYVDRHANIARELSNDESTNTDDPLDIDWKVGTARIEHSTISHFLSAVIRAKQGDQDGARIEHESMLQAIRNQNRSDILGNPEARDLLASVQQPQNYNTLVVAFSGRSPIKIEERANIRIHQRDLTLRFAFPVLEHQRNRVVSVRASASGQRQPLIELERMDQVAESVYEVQLPLIYARTVLRSYLRGIATREASSAVESEYGQGAGFLSELILGSASEAIESADLRSWTTLPGRAHVTLLDLPPGKHEVALEFRHRMGRVMHKETHTVNVSESPDPDALYLVEGIYWR